MCTVEGNLSATELLLIWPAGRINMKTCQHCCAFVALHTTRAYSVPLSCMPCRGRCRLPFTLMSLLLNCKVWPYPKTLATWLSSNWRLQPSHSIVKKVHSLQSGLQRQSSLQTVWLVLVFLYTEPLISCTLNDPGKGMHSCTENDLNCQRTLDCLYHNQMTVFQNMLK